MLIALLVVLGVDLVVVVALVALVLGRRRWLKRQPGEFPGAIRVSSGTVHGLRSGWRRGHGRWVRDVLVWNPAPLTLRTVLLPIDRLLAERVPTADVKRLGDHPVAIRFASDDAEVEVAARAEHRELAAGPLTLPPPTASSHERKR